MPTYFKYKEHRPEDVVVDWSGIAKNLSDTLLNEKQSRDERKAAYEQASSDFQKKLNDAPVGSWDNLNKLVQNATSDTQQIRLMQDRLFKSGLLPERDYKVQRQNITDGWDSFARVSKNAQDMYAKNAEKLSKGEIGETGKVAWGMLEKLADFQNSQLTFDESGQMKYIYKDPESGEAMVMPVQTIERMMNIDYPKYDINAAVKGLNIAKTFDKVFKSLEGIPGVRAVTVSDVRGNQNWKNIEDAWVNTLLNDDQKVAEVLMAEMSYDAETDPNKKKDRGENVVFFNERNGVLVPDFTDDIGKKQLEAARGEVRDLIDGYLPSDTKIDFTPVSGSSGKSGGSDKDRQSQLEEFGRAVKGIAEGNTDYLALVGDGTRSLNGRKIISYDPPANSGDPFTIYFDEERSVSDVIDPKTPDGLEKIKQIVNSYWTSGNKLSPEELRSITDNWSSIVVPQGGSRTVNQDAITSDVAGLSTKDKATQVATLNKLLPKLNPRYTIERISNWRYPNQATYKVVDKSGGMAVVADIRWDDPELQTKISEYIDKNKYSEYVPAGSGGKPQLN